jgi:choline kinase
MCAANELVEDVIISYSDIFYNAATVAGLLANECDIRISVDFQWRKNYVGRTEHPESEAEKVVVENGHVTKIGKHLHGDIASGEFIGLCFLKREIAVNMVECYKTFLKNDNGGSFFNAQSIHTAYLTDMLTALIDTGVKVKPVPVSGLWAEIDTEQDFIKLKTSLLKV